jgi:predicted nucleic acid-binding Zn ribbon protein
MQFFFGRFTPMFIKAKSLRKPEASTMADAIQSWIKINHLEDKLAESDITLSWPSIAGPLIARHTRRIRIQNKILKIEVDNAPLREQLNLSKTRILKLVNDKAGRQLVIECLIF